MFLAPVYSPRPGSGDAEVLALWSHGVAGSGGHGTDRVDCSSRRRTFMVASNVEAVPQARHAVSEILETWGVESESDLAYAVQLIVTELVTNAVVHAGQVTPRIAVTVEAATGGELGVGVGDNDPGHPSAGAVSADATGGRGLAIIETLLAELGGDTAILCDAAGGKTVWARLPAHGGTVERAA
ncbi:ATP-binding protein [Kitasatospora sp. NPDC059571]|uniref:ATP-binding protein n=1 Tax=Kitasatospora sp. NPDC059571 TaxID=3346871 RepID=UPI0036D0737D